MGLDPKGYIPEIISRPRVVLAMALVWEAKIHFEENQNFANILEQDKDRFFAGNHYNDFTKRKKGETGVIYDPGATLQYR